MARVGVRELATVEEVEGVVRVREGGDRIVSLTLV